MWEGGSLGAHKTTFNSAYAGRDSIQNTQNGGKPGTTVLVRYWRRQKISMSLRVPTLVKDPVNTGLKTLFWMAWWLISRVGCHWSKTGSLVLYVLRLSIYTLVTCKLPWSVLLHTCVWSTRHGWGPCSSCFGRIYWFVLLYSYTRVSPVKDWRRLSLLVWCSDVKDGSFGDYG